MLNTLALNSHPLTGIIPLLRKEFGSLLRPRNLIMTLVGWTLFLNGFLLFIIVGLRQIAERPELLPEERAELMQLAANPAQSVLAFFIVAGIALAIASIVTLQDAVLYEKQNGTAAWILSKPVTRLAFIASKLFGHIVRFIALIMVPQMSIAYLQFRFVGEYDINFVNYLAAIPVLILFVLFFSSLTLMLGTLFESRTWIIGIPVFLIMGYQLITGIFPSLVDMMPYALVLQSNTGINLITEIVMGQPLRTLLPVICTGLYVVVFTLVAIVRF